MAMIDGRDICDSRQFGGGDHGSVHGPERQAVVAGDEFGDPEQVSCVNGLESEVPGCQVTQKPDLGLPAEAAGQQVGDLGDNEARDEKWAGMAL